MAIAVTCQCGQRLQAKDELAGKRIKCPKCGQPLTVTDPLSSGDATGAFGLDDLSQFESDAPSTLGPALGQPAIAGGLNSPFSQGGSSLLTPTSQGQAKPAAKPAQSKKTVVILASVAGGVVAIAVVVVLILVLGGKDPEPAQTAGGSLPKPEDASSVERPSTSDQTPEQEPAQPKPMRVAEFEPVELAPGFRKIIEFKVERNGLQGPIQVLVDGAPEGVLVKTLDVPPDSDIGKLSLEAADKFADEGLEASLTVIAKAGDLASKQPLAISVAKLNLPRFKPITSVIVPPGTSADLTLEIERNGYEGPLACTFENVPPKVNVEIGELSAEQNESQLQIKAAPDAPVGKSNIIAAAKVGDRTIKLVIPLQIDKNPYTVKSLQVVTLQPGEQKQISIQVVRGSYQGPIQLDTGNLPQGVTVSKTVVAPDQASATLAVSAAADAVEGVRSIHVIATAGHLERVDPMIIRVSTGEAGLLPKELTEDPELTKLVRRGGFGGRLTAKSKNILLRYYGGTPQSEQAVLLGLRWLARHQRIDGGWSLTNYSDRVAGCDCKTAFESEVTENETAATAFGLLPFLGAGIAPNRAPDDPPVLAGYQANVANGLNFLMNKQDKDPKSKQAGRLDSNMYAHALGTMALCEAYALSGDEELKQSAQLAIRYVVTAQHEKGGGWRYAANQAGDMSVTGWMFLAIRDGQLSGLQILKAPLLRAERFVDSCGAGPEDSKLSQYSYVPDEVSKLTTTAAGLLTRQYLGWKREKPELIAGCQHMMKSLPPAYTDKLGSIYYHYYATQVLHHMGGADFDLWNHLMREHLIRTQRRAGHEAGSWAAEGCDHGAKAGRIYATSMALMTLQVYYRHLPIYGPSLRELGSSTDE